MSYVLWDVNCPAQVSPTHACYLCTRVRVRVCVCVCVFSPFKATHVSLTLMSVRRLPARMKPPALTSLVITSANAWLRLKVMSTEGMGTKKAKLINFTYYYFHLSELTSHVWKKGENIFIWYLWLNKEKLSN